MRWVVRGCMRCGGLLGGCRGRGGCVGLFRMCGGLLGGVGGC